MQTRAITIRLPAELYVQVRGLSEKSINSFVIGAIEEKLEIDRRLALAKAYAALAEDDSHICIDEFQDDRDEALRRAS